MSLILRAAEMNVFPLPKDMLGLAGIVSLKPAFIPFSHGDAVGPLGQLLGIGIDEIACRFHTVVRREGYADSINWYGTPLPRKYISTDRRISPRSLKKQRYDRAVWSIRALSFCPSSFERLIASCPHCPKKLAWKASNGIHVCPNCGRSLLKGKPGKIPWRLRKLAKLAADLVNPSPILRSKAIKQFPEPFRSWEPGDVFVAIVEMGLFDSGLGEQEYNRAAKLVSAGDFSEFDVGHLVTGVKVLMDWPRSLHFMLGSEISYRAGGINKCLGRFGRFMGNQMAKRPIVDLLRAEAQSALRERDIPLGAAGVIPDWLKRDDRISAKEAVGRYGIDMKTLRRLNEKGHCVVRQDGREEFIRYDPRLESSVAAYKDSISIGACARKLGVPAFVIPELEAIDLLSVVSDHDAILLADGEARLTKASLRAVQDAIERKPVAAGPGVSIAEAMAGVLDPSRWASVLKAIASGSLRKIATLPKGAPPMVHLVVHVGDMETLCRNWSQENLPVGIAVSLPEAARLLGWTIDAIECEVERGRLRTFFASEFVGRKCDLRVRLDQLARLRDMSANAVPAV